MQKDYLAIILIGGGSSYGRADSEDEAVSRAITALYDWSHLYQIDGAEVTVNLYDVTGNDQLWWDDCGVHADREADFPITTLEMRIIQMPDERPEDV